MKKIIFKKDFSLLYFNSDFYMKSKILETINIYSDFGKFSLSVIGKYFVLKIIVKGGLFEDLEYLSFEFMNYLLSLEHNINLEDI